MAAKIKNLKCKHCSCKVRPFKEELEKEQQECVRGSSCGLTRFNAEDFPTLYPEEMFDELEYPAPKEIHIRSAKDFHVITRR